MRIYVGCGLTHAPEKFRQEVESFKDALRHEGYEVLDFVGLTGGTPEEVFEYDLSCVRGSDLFVAICDYPSIGLGGELVEAGHHGKQVLAVAHHDALVTRFVLGMNYSSFLFQRYGSLSEVVHMVASYEAVYLQQVFDFQSYGHAAQ